VLEGLQIYYLFGLFWWVNFINAVEQTTIAGGVASWYWSRDKKVTVTPHTHLCLISFVTKAIKPFPLLRSMYRCFRYHLGSLAFGSLIIAIIQLIRYFVFMTQKKMSTSTNEAAKMALSCLQCCFTCLEKVLKFINKNAYIEIAVYGYSFCEAARTAFELLVRNAFRYKKHSLSFAG
jgi:hypothetical protein